MRTSFALAMAILLVLSFPTSASSLQSGVCIGWDSELITKSDASMTVAPGRLSFWGNGDVRLQISAPSDGLYKFIISAWGSPVRDLHGNEWPIMKLTVDDSDICAWEVRGQKALFISAAIELKAGDHEAKIAFTNDYRTEEEDRNLFVDGIAFGNVKEKADVPALMFQGKPVNAFGKLIEAKEIQQLAKRGVEPFYPAMRLIPDYSPRTISSCELSLTLKNGMFLRPEEFDNALSLDGEWKISGLTNSGEPFPKNVDHEKGYWRARFDDRNWDTIKVPLDWYVMYPENRIATQPYVSGWYRKTIALPWEHRGKRVIVEFDAIGYEATLYVNGKLAGSHHGDFTPWEIDITPWVDFGANNTLAIQVLTDFGPIFGDPKPAKHAYGSLWSIEDIKGGIWQSARLRFEEPVYLQRMLITPLLAQGAIEVDYWIENHSQEKKELSLFAVVSSAMKGDEGVEAANVELGKISVQRGSNQGRVSVKLENPHLWTPDNPYLYHLTLALADQQGVINASTQRFGFREFKAVGKDFYLNGERVYLFGENLPAVCFGGFGATEDQDTKKLAEIMVGFKRQGYNIIRNAHMPIIPLALELADEIGMMFYNEWAWCFIDALDPDEFELRNLEELTEWVYRDYNHPSVVMWSCGNEVTYSDDKLTYDQLNKQVALVRNLDRSGRPVSSFSGAAYGYGTEKLDTDVIDLHIYLGLSSSAWTNWEASLDSILELVTKIYGETKRLTKPFVVWECVGYSWGQARDPSFGPNDIDKYASYAKRATTWAEPAGIGFAGTIGLAAALDPDRGLRHGREHYGKRTMELIRYQHENVQGFAPWFHDHTTRAAPLWNQPLFVGLRGEGGVPLTNLFAGRSYQQVFFITNSQANSFKNLQVKLSIVGVSGEEKPLTSFAVPELWGWQKQERTCSIQIPKDLPAGSYQIRLIVFDAEKEVSRNYYDVFVQEQKILRAKIESQKRIAVLAPNTANGALIKKILTDVGIQFAEVADLAKLEKYEVLIIPPSDEPYQLFEEEQATLDLMGWVRKGGTLLQLEQNCSEQSQQSPIGQTLLLAENTFVDLAIPAHPVFRGLGQEHFDTWHNPNRGYCIVTGCQPFTANALAVRGPFLGSTDVSNAVAEGTHGRGRIFSSQLAATGMWGMDSAATTYLRNVLSYLLQEEEPYEGVRGWINACSGYSVAKEQVVPIDLKARANRGFGDIDGDGKGGRADQAHNGSLVMPPGTQVFAGVPFNIIDPAKNDGRSCIALGGCVRTDLPKSCENIAVQGHFTRLFFLHTAALTSGKKVGAYEIRYTDGSGAMVDVIDGVNVGDWRFPGDLPQAQIGFIAEDPLNRKVGLWVMEWENHWPEKEIAAIEFLSTGASVPVLVGISGEKANLRPLIIDDFEQEAKWAALSDGKGAIPTVELCERQSMPQCVFKGNASMRVAMPEKTAAGTPVVFGRFPLERLQAGEDFRYLTFWVKADNPGIVSVVLPKDDWSSSLSADVLFGVGEWQKVRLNLWDDMGLREQRWSLGKLRGELFFYNCNTNQPTVFYLDEIQFE